jgi:hypothetical protein
MLSIHARDQEFYLGIHHAFRATALGPTDLRDYYHFAAVPVGRVIADLTTSSLLSAGLTGTWTSLSAESS